MSRPASSARRRRFAFRRRDAMVRHQQLGRRIVRHDGAREAELAPQQVVEDRLRPAAGETVDGGVRVHHRREVGFGDRGTERLRVHLAQLAPAELHGRVVEPAFRQRVAEKVLPGRGNTVAERALHAAHVRHTESAREVRRLAVRLLDAPEARITRHVEHRRERVARARRHHLASNHGPDLGHELGVPRCREADRLRELRRVARDTILQCSPRARWPGYPAACGRPGSAGSSSRARPAPAARAWSSRRSA